MLLQLLTVCSLLRSFVSATCTSFPPDVLLPSAYKKTDFVVFKDGPGFTNYLCKTGKALAQYDKGGALIWILNTPTAICNEQENKLTFGDKEVDMPYPIAYSCADFVNPSPSVEFCNIQYINVDGFVIGSVEKQPALNLCPSHMTMQLDGTQGGTVINSFTCSENSTHFQYVLESAVTVDTAGLFIVSCKSRATTTTPTTTTDPTTTTISTTTTTVAETTTQIYSPQAYGHLWEVKYYYNWGALLHAYCATSDCRSAIAYQAFDLSNGSGLLGMAISESSIDEVRAKCPEGSKHLRNLGFTRRPTSLLVLFPGYEHNFNGDGFKQGWVSVEEGACGATRRIKRWKCSLSDDLMYGENLEGNTLYQGRVQDGGAAQFYMW